jgi:ABC-2 type transport system ATP-binding protein
MNEKGVSVLDVQNLTKSYGTTVAVDGISFMVSPGEVVGLLGPNGAGKTTTINMVLGVLEPTAGSISIGKNNIGKQRSEALQETNFAAVYAQLPGNLSVWQNLHIFGLIYNVPDLRDRIEKLIAEFALEKFRNAPCGVLSSGEQTRVNLAKAMLNKPRLLLLDEPTASLDPSTAETIRAQIKNYAISGAGGVLWTSHNMYEVTDVCDRILFLSHGKILLEGDPKTLPQEHGKKNLEELFIAIAREPLLLEST